MEVNQAHLAVNEADEMLHAIQDGLNLKLDSWSPCLLGFLVVDNSRLTQSWRSAIRFLLPPFFLMDGIVLAKGLGCPSRTFFERGSAASERACENKYWTGQRLRLPFALRKKGGLMGSGAHAER